MVTKVVNKGYEPSWEIFDECPTCYSAPKQPCYDMKQSTSKNLVINLNPHRGRRKLKE